MERDRDGDRNHRGDDEYCELQHGDHDVPPDWRSGELHGHDQSHVSDNKGLNGECGLGICVGNYTKCRAGLATPGAENIRSLVLG
jgi:hypothetical protein